MPKFAKGNNSKNKIAYFLIFTSEEIKLFTSIPIEDHQKKTMFYHFLKETLQAGPIIQNVYRVHGAKYVECGVSTLFISSTKD